MQNGMPVGVGVCRSPQDQFFALLKYPLQLTQPGASTFCTTIHNHESGSIGGKMVLSKSGQTHLLGLGF
jgi:hypothetical protein